MTTVAPTSTVTLTIRVNRRVSPLTFKRGDTFAMQVDLTPSGRSVASIPNVSAELTPDEMRAIGIGISDRSLAFTETPSARDFLRYIDAHLDAIMTDDQREAAERHRAWLATGQPDRRTGPRDRRATPRV